LNQQLSDVSQSRAARDLHICSPKTPQPFPFEEMPALLLLLLPLPSVGSSSAPPHKPHESSTWW
jgi:hypothetical protein